MKLRQKRSTRFHSLRGGATEALGLWHLVAIRPPAASIFGNSGVERASVRRAAAKGARWTRCGGASAAFGRYHHIAYHQVIYVMLIVLIEVYVIMLQDYVNVLMDFMV
mgnify:CR=1 FL=1